CAHAAGSKAPLGHPSLVTHLCQLAGVDVSVPPFEQPRKTIDFAFYMQYCLPDDLTSIHKGQLATSQMLRELTYAMSELNMMTAAEFDDYVAWPGDQSNSAGGGGAAADEDDEEENDDDFEESDDNIS
ncbi:hypothetical protein V8G54_002757, partial [Vigna mungo]